MAQVAVLYRPRDFTVMACAAELTIDDFDHVNFIAAGLELETEIGMADLAAKPNPMKPVRENRRAHPCGVRVVVDHNVTVLSSGIIYIDGCCCNHRQQAKKQPAPWGSIEHYCVLFLYCL
jgi:hypothetical protein